MGCRLGNGESKACPERSRMGTCTSGTQGAFPQGVLCSRIGEHWPTIQDLSEIGTQRAHRSVQFSERRPTLFDRASNQAPMSARDVVLIRPAPPSSLDPRSFASYLAKMGQLHDSGVIQERIRHMQKLLQRFRILVRRLHSLQGSGWSQFCRPVKHYDHRRGV